MTNHFGCELRRGGLDMIEKKCHDIATAITSLKYDKLLKIVKLIDFSPLNIFFQITKLLAS